MALSSFSILVNENIHKYNSRYLFILFLIGTVDKLF